VKTEASPPGPGQPAPRPVRTISGGDRSITGETIRGLLAPVMGKSGAVYLAVSNIGQVRLALNENSS